MAKQTITYEPKILDLILYAGDGPSFRLMVKNPSGVPIPLTGTMMAQIRVSRNSPDPPVEEFTIDLTESADGIATISLTGEQTQALAPTEKFAGVWDLEWTPSGSEPVTLCQGTVGCLPDVSR